MSETSPNSPLPSSFAAGGHRARLARLGRGPKALIGLTLSMLLVAAGVLGGGQIASALSQNVAFSAVDLPTWQTNGVVYALGSSNGRVVVGGTFDQIRPPAGGSAAPKSVSALAILDAETGAPTSCQIPLAFSAGTASVRAITVSPDGNTVFIGGNFTSVGNKPRARVAAIDVVDCTVKSYSTPGITGTVYGLAIHDNTLYLAGQFIGVGGQTRNRFAATNATTGALLPFAASADKTGRAIAVSPDGTKVAIGGDITEVNGQFSHSIAIVDAVSGANIKTYDPSFVSSRSQTKGIYSGNDGQFYVSNEGTGGGVFDGRFAVNWNTGEEVWRDTCLGATQATLEYLGTLYSASHAHDCRTNNSFQDGKRNFFLAQNTSDGKLLGWHPNANDGTGEGIGPRAMTVARGATPSEDILYYGGEFTRVNGELQQGLTRFNRTDSAKPSTPQVVTRTLADGSIQLRARAAVDDDDDTLTYRVFRNGGATPVWEGQGTSLWWKRPQVSFVDSNVTPGTTYRYVLEVTDGTNKARSAQVSAKAGSVTADSYETVIRNDSPASYWRSQVSGGWVEDAAATTSDANAWSGLADGPTESSDSAVVGGDGTGSLSFDGSNDFLWEQNYRPAPDTYSAELWFKTTTDRGGKLIGFGNARPRTDTGAMPLSGSYDRHVYMSNNGQLNFGVYTGSTTTISSDDSYNDGEWHHVVATQGAKGMQLIVDSQLLATNPDVTAGQDYWGVWHVGGDNTGGWPNRPSSDYFAGQIDEVGIYNTQLDRRQVTGHYQAGGGEVTVNTTPGDDFGAQAFADNPALYWRLDDGSASTAKDSSYYGEQPGVYGSPVTRGVAGIPGAGDNAAVSVPGSLGQAIATDKQQRPANPFTAEVWFKTTSNTGGKLLGFESTQTGNGSSYDKQIYVQDDGRLRFGTYDRGVSTVASDASYNDGKWHQAVGQLSPAGMKLFVDGQLVAENGRTTAETGSGYWRIGGGSLGGWPGEPSNFYFDGALDEALIYHSALTPAQIEQHFLAGTNDTEPPAAPSDVVAQPGSPVEVSWSPSADNLGTTGYRIYRGETANFDVNAASLIGETAETQFADTATLAPGKHYYKVTAVDASGNVSDPSDAAVVDLADLNGPTQPLGVTTNVDAGTATVTWQASTDDVGVAGYRVYRGTEADFTPEAASLVGEVTERSLADAGLTVGTYYYKVVAFDEAGNSSEPSDGAAAVVADADAPSVPGNLTATPGAGQVALAWEAATDDVAVTGYVVYRSDSASAAATAETEIARTEQLSYTDAGLSPGEYFYRVAAIDEAGNIGEATDAVQGTVGDVTAPTAPAGLTASAGNYAATLAWSAAEDNVEVTGYRLYRSTTADFEPGADYLVTETTALNHVDSPLALDTYYYQVTAVDGAGNESAASNVASVEVSTGTSPDAPEQLAAELAGGNVELTWQAPTDGVTPAQYIVYRGASADFTPTEANSLGTTEGLNYTDNDPETGANFYRVVAVSEAGNRSVPTDSVEVTVTDASPPSRPAALTADVEDRAVSLTWQASNDNVGVVGYEVHRGTSAGFTPGVGSRVDTVTGTSWSDTEHPIGDFFYKGIALDAAGNTSAASNAVEVNVADPTATEVEFSPAEDAAVYQSAPNNNYGTNTQLWARGTSGQQSFLKFDLPANPAGKSIQSATLQLRTSTDTIAGSADSMEVHIVSGSWNAATLTWNNRPTNAGAKLGATPPIADLNTAFSVDLAGSPMNAWADRTMALRISGDGSDSLRMWSNDARSNYRPVLVVTYGAGGGGGPTDTEAPSKPASLTADVDGSDVALDWDASTDNVGVTRYSVYRGDTAGFEPSAANRIGTSSSTAYTNRGVELGTYFYRVVAFDEAGNASDASAAAEATIAQAPTQLTAAVEADAAVYATGPDTNRGSYNQLFARGSSAQESFVSFAVPANPSGQTLGKAELRIRTSNDGSAGSTAKYNLDLVSDSWSEDTVTWNNRPTTVVAKVGEIVDATATNTEYTITLDAAELASYAGSTVTLRVKADDASTTNNLRLFSSEYAASVAPQLQLTYS